MTKLKFNSSKLTNSVLPSLESAINSLNSAYRCANSSVPDSFSYRSYMLELDSKICGFKDKLVDCEDWLEKSILKVNRTLEEIEKEAVNLDEFSAKQKDNSVIVL